MRSVHPVRAGLRAHRRLPDGGGSLAEGGQLFRLAGGERDDGGCRRGPRQVGRGGIGAEVVDPPAGVGQEDRRPSARRWRGSCPPRRRPWPIGASREGVAPGQTRAISRSTMALARCSSPTPSEPCCQRSPTSRSAGVKNEHVQVLPGQPAQHRLMRQIPAGWPPRRARGLPGRPAAARARSVAVPACPAAGPAAPGCGRTAPRSSR